MQCASLHFHAPEYAETTIPLQWCQASLHLPHTGAWHSAADGSLDGRHLPPRSRRPACTPLPSDLTAGGKVTSGRCVTNAHTAPMRRHSHVGAHNAPPPLASIRPACCRPLL
ncbi:Hypothetical predicted protein [Pelobates cultripes]|uniref:Uncharacterized protein n=1 Tax=Pelobates cultripes TaxID=61616 RepID=A0AAD1SB21_PELCU|nr:Hypothetical predicted protein [Pelobates cultripes]